MTHLSPRMYHHLHHAHLACAGRYRALAKDLAEATRPDWYGRSAEWQHEHARVVIAAARSEIAAAKRLREQQTRSDNNG